MKSFLFPLGLFLTLLSCTPNEHINTHYVFVGSANKADSVGIGIFEWNPEETKLHPVTVSNTPASVSYLTVDALNKRLYCVGSEVSAFQIESDGSLHLINQIAPAGRGACHVSISNDNRFLLVAYYTSGGASMYAIEENGAVGELVWSVQHEGSSVNTERQEAAHAHMILSAPNSNLILVPDLGLDKVMVYSSDSAGYVSEAPNPFATITPGGGPRHAVFHPGGNYVFVLHELTGHVSGFKFDAKKGFGELINTVPALPEEFSGFNKSADIQITPDGQYLYASNRGHNSLAVFRVNSSSGELTFLGTKDCGGIWPRAFAVDPSGKFLLIANKKSNQISVMSIDYETGFFEKVSEIVTPLEPQVIRFIDKF